MRWFVVTGWVTLTQNGLYLSHWSYRTMRSLPSSHQAAVHHQGGCHVNKFTNEPFAYKVIKVYYYKIPVQLWGGVCPGKSGCLADAESWWSRTALGFLCQLQTSSLSWPGWVAECLCLGHSWSDGPVSENWQGNNQLCPHCKEVVGQRLSECVHWTE